MSVYSRCVDARGTTSIESTPALRHPSKPVLRSRCVSGAFDGSPGCGVNDDSFAIQYGCTLKPYSDWTPSAGTLGVTFRSWAKLPLADSLSSATTVSTRGSTPCTYETAAAPSEWPMIATRVERPGVTVRGSGLESNSFQYGLNELTGVLSGLSSAVGLVYLWSGVERKKLSASCVP